MKLWEVSKKAGAVIMVVAESIRSLFIYLKNNGIEDQVNGMHVLQENVEVAELQVFMGMNHSNGNDESVLTVVNNNGDVVDVFNAQDFNDRVVKELKKWKKDYVNRSKSWLKVVGKRFGITVTPDYVSGKHLVKERVEMKKEDKEVKKEISAVESYFNDTLVDKFYYISLPYAEYEDLCELFRVINRTGISKSMYATVEPHISEGEKPVCDKIVKAEPIVAVVEITVMNSGFERLEEGFSYEEYLDACSDYTSYSVNDFFKEIEEDKEFLNQIPFICAVDLKNNRVLTFLKDNDRYISIFTADRIDYFNELMEDKPSISNMDNVAYDNLCELFDHINSGKMTSVDIAVVAKIKRIKKDIKLEDSLKEANKQFKEEGKQAVADKFRMRWEWRKSFTLNKIKLP